MGGGGGGGRNLSKYESKVLNVDLTFDVLPPGASLEVPPGGVAEVGSEESVGREVRVAGGVEGAFAGSGLGFRSAFETSSFSKYESREVRVFG